ncbi:cellulose biosynthesis protein BcsQ [Zhihengliuella halotolerans]|uniref:Cellulose biosynthesis protein BcsQ n=1 Tax=Zhihengliuella halotolerans TaxID=370736 RepID=A0A4Q8ACB4_9MICC|nr:cellulose biosynthesis protein BcsQ [Zhihengliuella halotolerans]
MVGSVQVVSISSLKGGVGKTSVTLGLASAALAAGTPTLVVDLDPHADASTGLGVALSDPQQEVGRQIKAGRRGDLEAHAAVSPWTQRGKTAQGAVLDVAVGGAFGTVYDRPDLRNRDLRRLKSLLEKTSKYQLVLIDCPPSLNGLTRMAWTASHQAVLVAEPSLFSVAGTERTMRALDMFRNEFNTGLNSINVVANRFRDTSTEQRFRLSEMRRMFGSQLLTPVLPDQADWQQIQGAAYSVHQWPGESARTTATHFDQLLKGLSGTSGAAKRSRVRTSAP